MAKRTLEATVIWGDTVLDRVHLFADRTLRIAELHAEVDLSPKLVIAEKRGAAAIVRIPDGALAYLRSGDLIAPVLEQTVALEEDGAVVFSLCSLSFVFRMVDAEVELDRAGPRDWAYPRLLAFSATAHAFLVATSLVTPPKRGLDLELLQHNPKYIKNVRLKEEEKKPVPFGKRDVGRFSGKEGLIGRKDRPIKEPKPSAPRIDPDRRKHDVAVARNAGLLRHLQQMNGGAIGTVLSGDIGKGINVAMSGIKGSGGFADAGGAGGMGTRGTGSGGGGNSIGIGGLRTSGAGIAGDPHGLGVRLSSRKRSVEIPQRGRDVAGDGLTREEVAAVIRRALPRIKFCYEKELQSNPNLRGKINARFTIAPNGSVARAQIVESTLEHARVDACVTKVIESLEFPKPKGGGVVVVGYPFIFDSV